MVKPSRSFLWIAALFCIASLILYPYLKYSFNPDALAYLRIASYYQHGAWNQAINAYWSPLLSWLLCPFFAMGLDWLIAFHIINLAVALVSLGLLSRILNRHFSDQSSFARVCLLLIFSALLLFEQYTTVTPDLLTLCLLLWLVDIYLSGKVFARRPGKSSLGGSLGTGLLGAFLFFSKSYCFYFFIAFTGLYTIYYAVEKGSRQFPVKALLWLCLGFGLPSIGWLAATHAKYGTWQVTGAAAYNYNTLDSNGVVKHPFNSVHKLNPLPQPGAFCLWEDPAVTYHYSTAGGLSHRSLGWYGRLLDTNAHYLYGIFKIAGLNLPLLFALGFWVVSLLLRPRSRGGRLGLRTEPESNEPGAFPPLYNQTYLKLLLFTALYVSGYMLILVIDRYIWLSFYVVWIFVIKAFDRQRNPYPVTSRITRRLGTLLMILVTLFGLYQTLYRLPDHFYYGAADHVSEKVIAAALPPGSHIASWHTRDLWTPLCRYDLHDYGGIASYGDWPTLKVDLQKYAVDYLVLTDTTVIPKIPADIAGHLRPVTHAGNWALYGIEP